MRIHPRLGVGIFTFISIGLTLGMEHILNMNEKFYWICVGVILIADLFIYSFLDKKYNKNQNEKIDT